MSVKNEKPQEINFKYTFGGNYSPTYVNGAQGGFSPRGEMVIHFYMERSHMPESISHEITAEGAIGQEVSVEPKDLANTIVRHVDSGVVMNYDNARVFHAWLGEKLREIENLQRMHTEFAEKQDKKA